MKMSADKKRKKKLKKQEDTSTNLPAVIDKSSSIAPKDRDVLQLYLREIAKVPLLTKAEEKALTQEYALEQSPELFKKLVQANLRFVVKIAFEYARYGARVMDLIQEGNMGLMKAVEAFNPYKNVKLTTYAVWWIRSYMQDFLLRNWSLVRIGTTASQKKLFYRLKKEQQRLEREGIRPEPAQIAHALGVSEKDVETMQLRLSGGDISMSLPIAGSGDDDKFRVESRIADEADLPSDVLEASEQSSLFSKALSEFVKKLNERDEYIFNERLLSENPKTLLEIGESFNVSKERARQLEENIKKKLKAFLAENYPDISIG